MLSVFQGWLAATSEAENLGRKQQILNLVVLGLVLPTMPASFALLVMTLLGKSPIAIALAGLGMQPFFLLAYLLNRRGWVRPASNLPSLGIYLSMVFLTYSIGTGHVTYVGFAMATTSAGILLGLRAGLFYALCSALAQGGIGYLQAANHLPAPVSPLSMLLPDALAMGFGLAVIVAVSGIYNRLSSQTLEQEKTSRAEIQAQSTLLEGQVTERAQTLERRLRQLHTAAEVSRSISGTLDMDVLLTKVVHLVHERFDLYYVGLFMLDEWGEYAILREGTGEAGEKMLSANHKLKVGGESMVGWTTAHKQARIALDVGQEAVRFDNPFLPFTRSELALPIISGNKLLGALSVQSDQPQAFDQDDITVLQGIADSLATALDNARLFREVQANLEEIRSLHRQYLAEAWSDLPDTKGNLKYSFQTPEAAQVGSEADVRGEKIVVPLVLRDQVIGKFDLETSQEKLSSEDRILLEQVAMQAALALENARLLSEVQRQVEHEQRVSQVVAKAQSSLDIDMVLQNMATEIGKILGVGKVQVRLNPKPVPAQPKNGSNGQEKSEAQDGGQV